MEDRNENRMPAVGIPRALLYYRYGTLWEHFCTMRDRIVKTVPGVNRVLWDISEKPVATIEFE